MRKHELVILATMDEKKRSAVFAMRHFDRSLTWSERRKAFRDYIFRKNG